VIPLAVPQARNSFYVPHTVTGARILEVRNVSIRMIDTYCSVFTTLALVGCSVDHGDPQLGTTEQALAQLAGDPVNNPPHAGDEVVFLLEDSPATPINVLFSCFDLDGDPLSITAVSQPAFGTVTITGGGTGLTFQPAPNNEFGTSFTYTISDGRGGTDTANVNVSISGVDDDPIAVDDSATVLEDSGATVINVLSGDSDVDFMDTLIIPAVTQPLGGTAVTNGHQRLTFQPAPNFFGVTAFRYTVEDRSGHTASATVVVTVTPLDDPPTAVDDGFFVFEDEHSVPLDVLANDSDPDDDSLTIAAVTQPPGGVVTINEDAKGLTLQPQPNFHSTVMFTYTMSDGHGGSATATVRLAFFTVEDLPQAVDDDTTVAQDSGSTAINVLGNDTDVDGDPLTIVAVTQPSDGLAVIVTSPASIAFQPDAGFSGTTKFTYTVNDGAGNAATAMVTVHVTEVPGGRGCQAGGDPAGGALVVLIAGLMIACDRQRRRANTRTRTRLVCQR
jgi:large repetitive protein